MLKVSFVKDLEGERFSRNDKKQVRCYLIEIADGDCNLQWLSSKPIKSHSVSIQIHHGKENTQKLRNLICINQEWKLDLNKN